MSKELAWDDYVDDRCYGYEVWQRNEQTDKWRLVAHTDSQKRAEDYVEEAGDFSIEEITYKDNEVESVTEIYRRTA